MSSGRERNIHNIPADHTAYIGANRTTGQVKFVENGAGWYLFPLDTLNHRELGPSVTLAMGLTECCARYGRAKVSTAHLILRMSRCIRKLLAVLLLIPSLRGYSSSTHIRYQRHSAYPSSLLKGTISCPISCILTLCGMTNGGRSGSESRNGND